MKQTLFLLGLILLVVVGYNNLYTKRTIDLKCEDNKVQIYLYKANDINEKVSEKTGILQISWGLIMPEKKVTNTKSIARPNRSRTTSAFFGIFSVRAPVLGESLRVKNAW